MVGIGVVVAVRYARNDAELLAVSLGELARKTLRRRCQYGVVVLVTLREILHPVAHVGHNLHAELLRFIALAVMSARQSLETLGQSDETDTQRALVDDALHGLVALQLVAADPEFRHQQRELLGKCRLLELETLVQLTCRHLQQVV